MSDDTTIILTFVCYLLVVLALGVVAYWRTTNLADYILGGRRLGVWVTALSAQASDMSGWLLLGLPGLAYMAGLGAIWMPLGLAVGTYLNWQLIAPRLRRQTEALGNSLTLPDYLEARFSDQAGILRPVAAIVILIFLTVYAASALVAGGKLFQTVLGVPYFEAVLIGTLAILIYTAVGGFLAVSWTDTLQGVLMFFALVAACLVGVWLLGGLEGTAQAARARDPELTSLWSGRDGELLGGLGILSSVAWGLGYFGQPHILARFMALREPSRMKYAMGIAMVWVVVCLAAAVGVGMVGAGYLEQTLQSNEAAETVFMLLVQALFHPVIAGICLAAILAAVMSTADSQLLVASSAISEDLYKPYIRPNASQRELVWLGRAAVVVLAIAAFLVARDPESVVLTLVGFAWAGFGSAFGPVILMSLFWQRMPRRAALAGVLVGGGVVLIWEGLTKLREAGYLADVAGAGWLDLYAIVPGFVLSMLAIIVVTRLSPRDANTPQ